MRKNDVIQVESIPRYYELCGLGKPRHPLISIHQLKDIIRPELQETIRFTLGFYVLTIKHNCTCKSHYGQTHYDYDEGIMGFVAPMQVIKIDKNDLPPSDGWCLTFHPDLLNGNNLAQKIREYRFFYYQVNEALILSEDEERDVEDLLQKIRKELGRPIDQFSQDILISHLDLLLHYSNRFYTRQFITRKPLNNYLLSRFEQLLEAYFTTEQMAGGLPAVTYFAEQLNLSAKYFSDMLKQLTGLTAQQHIHEKLINKAKEKLSATTLSVSEIAYELGFEHAQSFSKLFKNKTRLSPLEFRQQFN